MNTSWVRRKSNMKAESILRFNWLMIPLQILGAASNYSMWQKTMLNMPHTNISPYLVKTIYIRLLFLESKQTRSAVVMDGLFEAGVMQL